MISTLKRNLYLKWLWLRHTYPFLAAHKPLCSRFRQDVLKFGPIYLCRSCTFVYGGIASGALFWWAFPGIVQDAGLSLFVTLTAATLCFSFPTWYKEWRRAGRDLVRWLLGIVLVLNASLWVEGRVIEGLAGALVLFLFWRFYFHHRHHRQIHACDGCPELGKPGACSGFTMQAARIRRYEDQASRFLMTSLPVSPKE